MHTYEKILTSTEKFRMCLGLKRIQKALELFDNPQNSMDFIHVAGTNGKGSVCAILEAILVQDGRYSIGKFSSPHLFDYTERFSVNGKNISKEDMDELVQTVAKKDEEAGLGLSEFEILTAVCFLYFKKKGVTLAIMETGLGGRYDATNVIKKPLVSIITSISVDHKERLGDTIEKIAFEKAGIIKSGCPCVFIKENKGYKTLAAIAKKQDAKIMEPPLEVAVENGVATINGEKCEFSLAGDFQGENLKLALSGLIATGLYDASRKDAISFEIVRRAISKVKWRFRMENMIFKGRNLLIDGCHNPDGARVLNEYLEKYHNGKKIKFIYGSLANKEYEKILDRLYKPEYDFCFYEFDHPNALRYKDLGTFKEKLHCIENPLTEIEEGEFDLCVVSGSLYMLGKIFIGIIRK